ncbi:MAG: ATP-binding protein [Chloroflexota bacterium]
MSEHLGIVVAGSLNKGVEVKLDPLASVEDMAVGCYVTIAGKKRRFFGMITDISLAVTDEALTANPPDVGDTFLTEVLTGSVTYGALHVLPMLTMDVSSGLQPVKTVPSHFSRVSLAEEQDMELIFGKEEGGNFWIGSPLDMETRLCLNLEEFAKRSNGIFGKSGTGKTFLTRILLIGMLQKSKAVNLVFDMHNEYGWTGTSESGSGTVKGLKQMGMIQSRVAVFTLDEKNTRLRGASPDFVVRIGCNEIEPEDIAILRETLNLTDLAVEAAYSLRRRYGKSWIKEAINLTDAEQTGALLDSLKIHEATFQNLQRGLNTIKRLPFIEDESRSNAVEVILSYLDKGTSVVLEFGRHQNIVEYILVANLLSRRIYNQYRERTEKAIGDNSSKPRPLVITIEEAHKFLSPQLANQTIFGTIAREMRKYNVSLLVIDQRPSGIDEEVMSQLGTKITCLLDNERDVDSVLAGVSGKSELRSVLARLAAKQQALIFGHAVPMPVAFRPRDYGTAESYLEFAPGKENEKALDKEFEKLWE